MRRLLIAAFALSSACGPTDQNADGIADGVRDPDSVSMVAPSTPQGTVSGQVLTTRYLPLEGATVALNVGTAAVDGAPRTTTSNAEGAFVFTQVPAGSEVLVSITKQGFATVRTRVVVPAAAGNFPINNGNAVVGPYALSELNGQLKVMVMTHSGRPARGARVIVQASPAAVRLGESGAFTSSQGAVVVEASTNDFGIATLAGLPAAEELMRLTGRYDVSVPPIDEDGDGVYESAGAFASYTGSSVMADPSPRVIELSDARAPGALQLLATNAPSLIYSSSMASENLVKPGEPIYLVFNQAVEPRSVLALLTGESGTEVLDVAATVTETGNVLQVKPAQSLQPGKEFNLSVRAASLDSGSLWSGLGYFFVGELGQPFPPALEAIHIDDQGPADGTLNPNERVFVRFTTPLGLTTGAGGLQAFINADINASGAIGDAPGELNNTTGFTVLSAEPLGTASSPFTLEASGYTTRFRFDYFGVVPVAAGTNVVLAFENIRSAWGEYQSVWGEPVIKNLNGPLTVQP